MIPHKLIICSPANFETVSKKFNSKKVVSDIHCDNVFATYIRKYPKGVFNIRVSDWTIWKPSTFPYFKKWN